MEQELCYPIKYAIQELRTLGGYNTRGEDITVGYIVSKCYVIKSEIEYQDNGDIELLHSVVFPYNNLSKFEHDNNKKLKYEEKRIIPHVTFHGVVNISVVTDLFDTYEEAKRKVDEVNHNFKIRKLVDESYNYYKDDFYREFDKIQKKILDRMAVCYEYEKYVSKHTMDLDISNTPIINKKYFEKMPTRKDNCFDTALKGSKVYLKEIGKKKK